MLSRRCPHCKSTDTRFVRSLGNLSLWLADSFVSALVSIFLRKPCQDGVFRVLRECRICRTRFRETLIPRDDPDACSRCGYLVRGNVTGICPECGQPLTEQQRTNSRSG